MNAAHRFLCRSGLWKRAVVTHLFPWATDRVVFGTEALEIGPGPGITTDLIGTRVGALTAIEIDLSLALALQRRKHGTNFRIVHGDATRMPFNDAAFDSVFSFTMLHHVPSAALQDRLFAEAVRVLRPGGAFVGTDSRHSVALAALHWFDTMVSVDPQTLAARLRAAGFVRVEIEVKARAFRFCAFKPDRS